MDAQHIPILKRVGTVLVIVGLADVAVMVYCVINQISYSSSLNIFAIVAGVFLLRGNLRAASLVRWFATFMIAAFFGMLIVFPVIQPISLTLTKLRLGTGSFFANLTLMVFGAALFAWCIKELGCV